MDKKPEIIIFSQNKLGGVQNYFYNLIKSDTENYFDKKWIFTDRADDQDSKLPQPYDICDEHIFTYGKEPIYTSVKRLNDLFSDDPGLVLVNHYIELIALHKRRLKNKTIIFFCHDEYYLDNAVKYEFLIDAFIAHNIQFYNNLRQLLPPSRTKDIYYLPYGIEIKDTPSQKVNNQELKLIFIARLHEKKGVYDLIEIYKILTEKGLKFQLTIIGDGPEKENLKRLTVDFNNIIFSQPKTTEEVLAVASEHDIFLLPSYLDGIPVALLEAMSVGLVPIIYQFNKGISEVVKENNGFIVNSGNFVKISEVIIELEKNRELLNTLSKNASKKIREDYNATIQFKLYYSLFKDFKKLKKKMRKKHIQYDGKLDYPFVPHFFRKIIRRIKKCNWKVTE